MRPNIGELLDGINKTIMSRAMPIVQRSGDMEALWELATGTRVMAFIMDRWKNEFGRLARENMAMEKILREAVAALKALDHPIAAELEETLERSLCDISSLPSIDDLEKQNADLKAGLEKFIICHEQMQDYGLKGLQAIRKKIRDFLKEITVRDFEDAQAILFFMK
jgi:hypothetical protein